MPESGGTSFIVGITVGPVGRFIGAGRRSRDLWYGSRLIAEVARRAALVLEGAIGGNSPHGDGPSVEFVVPPRDRLDESRLPSHQGPTISNRILARVRGLSEQDLAHKLEAVRQDIHSFLADELDRLAADTRFRSVSDDGVLQAQARAVRRGDFLELYAAAATWDGRAESPSEDVAVKAVHEHIDGLKQMRAFLVPTSRPGVPKSSMDGGWDSVLREADPAFPAYACSLELDRAGLGLRHEERLDAIGLLRRRALFAGTRAELPALPFPPISRVAADPWIAGVQATAPQRLARVAQELDRARHEEGRSLLLVATPCRDPGPPASAVPAVFPYDTSMLLEGGIDALLSSLDQAEHHKRKAQAFATESRADQEALERSPAVQATAVRLRAYVRGARRLLERLQPVIFDLQRDFGTPQPYYVLIEADGDGIGSLLEAAGGWDRRSLVRGLYNFADKAWGVVEAHHGTAFYIGGDELAAYLPLDRALAACRELMALFDREVAAAAPPRIAGRPPEIPTLSAGMVVAHVKEDLRSVRQWAHDALREAKERRREAASAEGWLCVFEEARGGARRACAGPVPVGVAGAPDRRDLIADLSAWQAELERDDGLSLATAYAWLELSERLGADAAVELAKADLPQRAERAGRVVNERLKLRLDQCGTRDRLEELEQCGTRNPLEELAHEILLSARLSRIGAATKGDRT